MEVILFNALALLVSIALFVAGVATVAVPIYIVSDEPFLYRRLTIPLATLALLLGCVVTSCVYQLLIYLLPTLVLVR